MNVILQLLLIHLITILIFHSGFIDSVDGAIYKKWKPYHLPKPFSCVLCSVNLYSLIFLLATSQFTLITFTYELISAVLTNVTVPLLKTVENYLLKIIEILNRPVL